MTDYSSKYPNAEVQGLDLSLIQPEKYALDLFITILTDNIERIPPNLSFLRRDIESPWHGMDLDSWDLIHMRMLSGSITSWPEIYQKVYRSGGCSSRSVKTDKTRHLKPGFGWLEHVELDMIPRCDDGTLPTNSQILNWSRYVLDATDRAYRPLAYNTDTRPMLERQGFVEIQEQVIKVPLNYWPTDPHLKDIGRWYNLGLTQGLDAMTVGPLTRMSAWKRADVDRLVSEAKRELCSKKYHAYCNM